MVNLSPINAKPIIGLKYFQNNIVQEQLLMRTQNLTDAVCTTLGRPGNPNQPVFVLNEGDAGFAICKYFEFLLRNNDDMVSFSPTSLLG